VLNGNKGVPDDLMNAPAIGQDALGLPEVGGANGVNSIPAAPEPNSEEVPTATPDVNAAKKLIEPASGAKIENTEAPKAETIKANEE
jgi:hypothetical protein